VPGRGILRWTCEGRSVATRPIVRRATLTAGCLQGESAPGAYPGYTVNALMEKPPPPAPWRGVEVFRSSASRKQGDVALLQRAKKAVGIQPQSLGADKGYFYRGFIEELLRREISPHHRLLAEWKQARRT